MSWERTYPYPVSPLKGASEDHFPFPQVGYVSSLEGILLFCMYIFVCFPFFMGSSGVSGSSGCCFGNQYIDMYIVKNIQNSLQDLMLTLLGLSFWAAAIRIELHIRLTKIIIQDPSLQTHPLNGLRRNLSI